MIKLYSKSYSLSSSLLFLEEGDIRTMLGLMRHLVVTEHTSAAKNNERMVLILMVFNGFKLFFTWLSKLYNIMFFIQLQQHTASKRKGKKVIAIYQKKTLNPIHNIYSNIQFIQRITEVYAYLPFLNVTQW